MNWRLVLALSGFGAAMGIATVYVIPPGVEPVFWFAIFLFCAWVIARRCERAHFLHGLAVSVVNSAWVTAAHVVLLDAYLASHPREAAMAATMPVPIRVMMVMTGPIVGVIFGLVLGLFSIVAARLVRPARRR